MKEIYISAEEFRAAFERYASVASSGTRVIIRDEGGELVLISAQEYARLRKLEGTVAMAVEALSPEELERLEKSQIAQESQELDRLLPKDW